MTKSDAYRPVEGVFSGKRAAEIVGITYRQLDYWARTDLVRPSVADAAGSGSRRQYSYRDLLELKVIKDLLDAGIKLESVRSVFTFMRENLGEDIASANLVITGHQVLMKRDEEIIDVVKAGQGVLNILPLSGVKGELDAAIIELYPEHAAATSPGTSPATSPSPVDVDDPVRSVGTPF
jgi:DNA-binding transcriptional MerR regulator